MCFPRAALVLWMSLVVAHAAAYAQKPAKAPKTGMVVASQTVNLPPASVIQAVLDSAYLRYKDLKDGANADYIKELAKVDPNLFGLALITVDGRVFTQGDVGTAVSIQSISKVFTLARVIEEQGARALAEKVGVDATGMRFNSIVAVEMNKGKEMNPMVNPGAIATTSLVGGADSAAKWRNIMQTMNAFAGRQLGIDWPVYISEVNDNLRNQSIAQLLKSYGRMYYDPKQATELYTRQCAISVNTQDLAYMAATLANGGVHPKTKEKVISDTTTRYVLSVMATAGLYDDSGQWLYYVGLPAKSGVGGGIIAVSPGKFGVAVVSPPLSPAGNSIRAQYSIRLIAEALGVNPFLVKPLR